jgi:ATP-dependent DNA helicase RecQ
MIHKALVYLDKYFGYKSFRKGQELIIQSVLDGNDTLGIMPTGGGKSLCYQIPALCFDGITIVISPLIALMKDQIDYLHSIRFPAGMLNSTVDFARQKDIMYLAENNDLKILYLTPERFRSESFLNWLKNIKISLFAIDEAHCISEWGHDFRPEYRKLSEVIKSLGNPQILALTATATKEVRDDISASLEMRSPKIFVSGFNRDNLIYGVQNHISGDEKNKALIDFIKKVNGAGIVYVSSIKTAEELFLILRSNLDKKVGIYHGSMKSSDRKFSQENFLNNNIEVLIATSAFGMGVNKPDIRFIVHYSIPGTIEAYYQETGRAGRDGKISYCLLLEFDDDINIQRFFIESKNPGLNSMIAVLENIKNQSKNENIYTDDFTILQGDERLNNFKIDSIIKQLHFMEMIDFDFISDEKIEITINRAKIKNEEEKCFIESILPMADDSGKFISAMTKTLMKRLDVPEIILKEKLKKLSDEKIIGYEIIKSGKVIKILKDKFTQKEKEEYEKKIKNKIELDRAKLQAVIDYSRVESSCRRKYLLNYFGEEVEEENCEKCDICRGTYKNGVKADFNNIQKEIIYFISLHENKIGKAKAIKILKGGYDIEPKYREWDECGILKNVNIKDIENEMNILLKNEIIQIKNGSYPTLKISIKGLNELKKNNLKTKN